MAQQGFCCLLVGYPCMFLNNTNFHCGWELIYFFFLKYLINWPFPEQCLTAAFTSERWSFPEKVYIYVIIFSKNVLVTSNFRWLWHRQEATVGRPWGWVVLILKTVGTLFVCVFYSKPRVNTMIKNIDLDTFLERLGFSLFFAIRGNKITLYKEFIGINFMETKELN